MCAGCHQSLSTSKAVIQCMFSSLGFPFSDSVQARPCNTSYHPGCIRVGAPFTTRRDKGAGLVFPNVRDWPHFICEACTVRSVVNSMAAVTGN
jgi:hypothetical protein